VLAGPATANRSAADTIILHGHILRIIPSILPWRWVSSS
jgi:hypothetical protein